MSVTLSFAIVNVHPLEHMFVKTIESMSLLLRVVTFGLNAYQIETYFKVIGL